jgi:uncharacterized protein
MFKALLFSILLYPLNASAENLNIASCEKAYKDADPKAFDICMPFAEKKIPAARRMVGDMYFWGWGGKPARDYKEAITWYKRAGSDGDAEAKYNLGVMYEKGKGERASITTAFKWYLSAAKGGHKEAQYNISNLYNTGRGIEASMEESFKWGLRAANQGVYEAQFNVANKYAMGKGVEPDAVEAYKWYYLAAKGGITQATASLAAVQAKMTAVQVSQAQSLADKFVPVKE